MGPGMRPAQARSFRAASYRLARLLRLVSIVRLERIRHLFIGLSNARRRPGDLGPGSSGQRGGVHAPVPVYRFAGFGKSDPFVSSEYHSRRDPPITVGPQGENN